MFGFLKRIPFWAKIFAGFTIIILVAVSLIYIVANEVIFAKFDEFAKEYRLRLVRIYAPFVEFALAERGGRRTPSLGPLQREIAIAFRPIGQHVVFVNEDGIIAGAFDQSLEGQPIDESIYEWVAPIRVPGQPDLSIWAGPGLTNRTDEESVFLNAMNQTIIWSGIIAAALGLILALWLIRQVTNPIRKLAVATERISHGEYGERVEIESQDALGQLGESFNTMSTRLAKSEELRRNMIADIAHELRTPLTLIQGNLQAILDDIYEPSKDRIEVVHEKSLLLSRLVRDLQELTLADAGELPLNFRITDANQLVSDVVGTIRPRVEEKGLKLDVDFTDFELPVRADVERIEQVLLNLLTNSWRYTDHGGEILVKTAADGDQVRISISDTGEGISESDLPLIFERFWRADSSRARGSGGSGLGLSIAKHLVEAHNGEILVESKLDVGSTFTLILPLADSSDSREAEAFGSNSVSR